MWVELKRAVLFISVSFVAVLLATAALASTHDIVPISGFRPGTIVIKTHERHLYYVLDGHRALRFPVAVGKAGMTWTGLARVEGKFVRPAWQAPPSIRRENPRLPKVIPGGAPNNPMGDAALTLRGGEYAIHGTNHPELIGGFVSHGCIRMYNKDITKLFAMVSVGTPVIVEK